MKHWIYSWRWVIVHFLIFIGVSCLPLVDNMRFWALLGTWVVSNGFLIEFFCRVFQKKYITTLPCYFFLAASIFLLYRSRYIMLHGQYILHDNDKLKQCVEFLLSIVPTNQRNDSILKIIEYIVILIFTPIYSLFSSLSKDKKNTMRPCEQWNPYTCGDLLIGRRSVYVRLSLAICCFLICFICPNCALWVALSFWCMELYVRFILNNKDYVNEISEKKVVRMVRNYLYEQLKLPASLNAFMQKQRSSSVLFIEKAGEFFSWKHPVELKMKWEILLKTAKWITVFVDEKKYREYLLFLLGLSFSVVGQPPERLLTFWEQNKDQCPVYQDVEVGVVTGVCFSANYLQITISKELKNKLEKFKKALNEMHLDNVHEQLSTRGNRDGATTAYVKGLFPVSAVCKARQIGKNYYDEYSVKDLMDAHQRHLERSVNENA